MLGFLDYTSLLLIFIFGVPHGAFDASIAMTLGYYKDFKSKFTFIIFYLLISLIVVFTWFLFPQFVLTVFLFVSILHFGLGDINWSKSYKCLLSAYINGGLIIFGISFLNYEEVDLIYQILVYNNETDNIWLILEYGAILWLILLPLHCFVNYNEFKKNYILRVIISSVIILTASPIFAFSFYFCFIHSFNHVKRILPSLKNNLSDKYIKNLFLFFTFFTWVLGILSFLYLIHSSSLDHSLIKVTFIGLAALTFPHMVLVDLYFRPNIKT